MNEEIDFDTLWNLWTYKTNSTLIHELAHKLNINPWELEYIGCAWSSYHFAWAFRMWKEEKVVGIRLINAMGQKWNVLNSKHGSILKKVTDNKDINNIESILNYTYEYKTN